MLFTKRALPLSGAEQEVVVAAIRAAEGSTSGEIRLFIEPHCTWVDAADRAGELFERLGMTKTELRNGVLIYVAYEDKQFAILGDTSIFTKAGGPVFWEAAGLQLRDYFKKDQLANGLIACITELGRALAIHFPIVPGINKNELPDEIIFGK